MLRLCVSVPPAGWRPHHQLPQLRQPGDGGIRRAADDQGSGNKGDDPSEWLKSLLLGDDAGRKPSLPKGLPGTFMAPEATLGNRLSGMLSALSVAGLRFERDWQHVFALTGVCCMHPCGATGKARSACCYASLLILQRNVDGHCNCTRKCLIEH